MAHELSERLRQWVQSSNKNSPFISDVLAAADELDHLDGGVDEELKRRLDEAHAVGFRDCAELAGAERERLRAEVCECNNENDRLRLEVARMREEKNRLLVASIELINEQKAEVK